MTFDPARDPFAEALSYPSLFVSPPADESPIARPVDAELTAAETAEAETAEAEAAAAETAPTGLTVAEAAEAEDAAPETVAEGVNAAVPATGPIAPNVVEAEPAPSVSFADLGLPRRLVQALDRTGIVAPFPIQAATIPDALAGRDLLGRGQTGSGKTLAFGLPVLVRMAERGKAAPHRPRALVLVPTRELAMQLNDSIAPLARNLGVFSRTAFGGTPYDKQIRDLRRGVDILVATPGRLGDLIRRGDCSLDDIEITVLDEADQMADMGFLPDVTELLEKTPEHGQRMLFSATLDGDVDTLVKRFMHEPVTHEVDPPSAAVTTMEHHLLLIPPREKFQIVASIGAREGRTIMFARTQMAVERLAEQLTEVGVRAGALHGGKTQRARTRTLAEFREGVVDVLVATDVAARGIHVDGVSLVLHIDPPKDSKDYLHRAGRTARAGESGTVVTLVMPRQRRSTYSMLEKAGVFPNRTEVRLGGPELHAVTGAREPNGVPVRLQPPSRPQPQDRPDRADRADRADRPRRFEGRRTAPHSSSDRPRRFEGADDRPRRDRGQDGDRPRRFEESSRLSGDRRATDYPSRELIRSPRRPSERDRSTDKHSAPYGHRRPRPRYGAESH
jgi:superfamily II DNA/RNA helicase